MKRILLTQKTLSTSKIKKVTELFFVNGLNKLDYEICLSSTHSIMLKPHEDIKAIINEKNAIIIQMLAQKNKREEKIGRKFKESIHLTVYFNKSKSYCTFRDIFFE